MSLIFEFADSEILAVTVEGDALRVRFSAATVRRDGDERGWMSGVVLTLSSVTRTGDIGHAFGKVVDGRLRGGGERASLPLPGTLSGPLELGLRFANGTLLAVHASTAELSAAPGAGFAEDLSC